MSRWRSRLVTAVAAVGALSLSAFIYTRTRAVDMHAHVAFTEELARVKHLSTVLKQETLASRFGLLNQYDALTETTHEIQRALVPTSPSMHNCDVAAVMRPADQVGGDYYDVFREGKQEWILIGDVSGHGVPAGLIMMMCQTAVRAALASNPGLHPDELLVIVNRTLTENIRRLGEDKYMTISALRRDEAGRFHHAGLHQDLLIYRAATGRVDCIASEGAWLGVTDHIDHLLTLGTFELATGDVLFLYTDGITEAVRVGDGKMLDNDGLTALLEGLGRRGAGDIVTEVVAHLDGYAVSDDVAAVAVKQC